MNAGMTFMMMICCLFRFRYGFNTTANYNDHELYCGGFARQHQKNGGKCGVCGDPWDGPKPNEAGGTYAQVGSVSSRMKLHL